MKKLVKFWRIIAITAIIGLVLFACDVGTTSNTDTCANGHTSGAAATCETAQTCTVCNYVIKAATGHNWGEWEEGAISASCTTASKDKAHCLNENCAKTEERIGSHPALGHDLPGAKAATCVATGLTGIGHCNRCNQDLTGEVIPINNEAHNFSGEPVITPAACVTAGKEVIACGNAGCNVKHETPIDAFGHDWEILSGTPSTCTTRGKGKEKCRLCGKEEEGDHLPLDEYKHVWGAYIQTIQPSCSAIGIKTQKCTECNMINPITEEGDAINPSAHDWSEWTVIQPTETLDGGDEERICSHDMNHIEDRATGNILYATGTAGLEYELVIGFPHIQDSNSYVVRAGTVTSGEVYIPAFHRPNADSEYLPVTHTGTSVGAGGHEVPLFRNNRDITAIHFLAPSNITFIGNSEFYNTFITTTLPEGLTHIGNWAFSGTKLTKITIPNGITYFTEGTFYFCQSLTEITLPEGLIHIGWRVFDECTSLTSVTFMGTITAANFHTSNFPGDLRDKYLAEDGGIGTYTREAGSNTWTKQN